MPLVPRRNREEYDSPDWDAITSGQIQTENPNYHWPNPYDTTGFLSGDTPNATSGFLPSDNDPWDIIDQYNPDDGGGPGGGGGFGGWNFNFGPVPQFVPPRFTFKDRFEMPSIEDMLADPGYQFRLGEGERALEQSAAGRGVLRTGGTLKDILKYGQNFASQEYGNVFDRSLRQFSTNYGVERDIFDRLYQGEKDRYSPNLIEWQTLAAAKQKQLELEFLKQQAIELALLNGFE